jgi:hypothetical protein
MATGTWSRLRLKCDGTCAETRFRLSPKRTSPFKSAGASVQSTTGRRGVRISLQRLYCSCKPVFCSPLTLTGRYTQLSFCFVSNVSILFIWRCCQHAGIRKIHCYVSYEVTRLTLKDVCPDMRLIWHLPRTEENHDNRLQISSFRTRTSRLGLGLLMIQAQHKTGIGDEKKSIFSQFVYLGLLPTTEARLD